MEDWKDDGSCWKKTEILVEDGGKMVKVTGKWLRLRWKTVERWQKLLESHSIQWNTVEVWWKLLENVRDSGGRQWKVDGKTVDVVGNSSGRQRKTMEIQVGQVLFLSTSST